MGQQDKKTWYVVIVKRNANMVDKYYRKDRQSAIDLQIMNKNLFPKAVIELKEVEKL